MRFNRDRVVIRSRGTLTVRDRTRQPHTISLVRAGDQPRTFRQMEACFEKGVCASLMEVRALRSTGSSSELLDSGAGVRGSSLALSGSALFWSDDGLPRAARL